MNIENIIEFNYNDLININLDLLERFILFLKNSKHSLQSSPFDWIDDNYWLNPSNGLEENSQYFTIGNSINFKFWEYGNLNIYYVKGIKGGIECKGSRYMWRCLKTCIDNNDFPILNATFLSKIKLDDMEKIFITDDGKQVMTSIEERWLNWKDLGMILLKNYKGQFYNLILKSEKSLERFIKFCKEFRAFDDPLYKMTMVNAILHQGRKIVDYNKDIFPGIDYHLITQVLRIGLLDLNKDLEYKIINKKLLTAVESLALRTATLKVLITVANELNLSGAIIDNIFFKNGKDFCTHNLICQIEKDKCVFEKFCKKKIKYFMPLENTRYY